MMELGEAWRQHLRLVLLRILEGLPGGRANDSVLADAVHAFGLGATRDQVRQELAWLGDHGLARLAEPVSGLTVASLTEAGSEVATGRRRVPGVKRPALE